MSAASILRPLQRRPSVGPLSGGIRDASRCRCCPGVSPHSVRLNPRLISANPPGSCRHMTSKTSNFRHSSSVRNVDLFSEGSAGDSHAPPGDPPGGTSWTSGCEKAVVYFRYRSGSVERVACATQAEQIRARVLMREFPIVQETERCPEHSTFANVPTERELSDQFYEI